MVEVGGWKDDGSSVVPRGGRQMARYESRCGEKIELDESYSDVH